jgi:hypothetical protein
MECPVTPLILITGHLKNHHLCFWLYSQQQQKAAKQQKETPPAEMFSHSMRSTTDSMLR